MDRDGFISNGELFIVLKMMVGGNLKDQQLQQIVDKTIMEADKNGDGKIDFYEFLDMVNNTDVAKQLTLEVRGAVLHTGPILAVSLCPGPAHRRMTQNAIFRSYEKRARARGRKVSTNDAVENCRRSRRFNRRAVKALRCVR